MIRGAMMRVFIITVAVLAALSSQAFAQATGQINGVVTDSSGGVVPGVTVTAVEQQTGLSRDTVSGANGLLHVSVTASDRSTKSALCLTGFRTIRRTGIELSCVPEPHGQRRRSSSEN